MVGLKGKRAPGRRGTFGRKVEKGPRRAASTDRKRKITCQRSEKKANRERKINWPTAVVKSGMGGKKSVWTRGDLVVFVGGFLRG